MKKITSFTHENMTIGSGMHSLRYVYPDWQAVLGLSASCGYLHLTKNPTQENSFKLGNWMREARDLQNTAIDQFNRLAPSISAIQTNPDLTTQAKERMASEAVEQLVIMLNTAAMDAQLIELFCMVKDGALPVTPLEKGDLGGLMLDIETRRFLSDMSAEVKKETFAQMLQGEHGDLVASVFRATNPITSGLLPEDMKRLEGAAIAAKYSPDFYRLLDCLWLINEVRVTALRVFNSLCGIGGISHLPLIQRIADKLFLVNPTTTEFRDWIESHPLPLREKVAAEEAKAAEEKDKAA